MKEKQARSSITSTSQHIRYLLEQGNDWNDIVNTLSEEWGMTLYRANIIVDYYKKNKGDIK
jgi:hypothetical protein